MWISEPLIETNLKFFQCFSRLRGEIPHHAFHNRLQEVFLVASLIHNREVYSMMAPLARGGPVIEDSLIHHPIQEENN